MAISSHSWKRLTGTFTILMCALLMGCQEQMSFSDLRKHEEIAVAQHSISGQWTLKSAHSTHTSCQPQYSFNEQGAWTEQIGDSFATGQYTTNTENSVANHAEFEFKTTRVSANDECLNLNSVLHYSQAPLYISKESTDTLNIFLDPTSLQNPSIVLKRESSNEVTQQEPQIVHTENHLLVARNSQVADEKQTLETNIDSITVESEITADIDGPEQCTYHDSDIYLSPEGSDTNTGSYDSPFRSLKHAIQHAQTGDRILFLDGTYYLKGAYDITKSIALKSYNLHGARLVSVDDKATKYGEELDQDTAFYVRFTGQDASNSSMEGFVIENVKSFKSYNVNNPTRKWNMAIRADNLSNFSFINNRLSDAADVAVQLTNTNAAVVEFNEFYSLMPSDQKPQYIAGPYKMFMELSKTKKNVFTSGIRPDQYNDYGISVRGTTETHIANNYFHGTFHQTISLSHQNTDITIKENTFDGSALTAIYVGQSNGKPELGKIDIVGNVFRPVVGEDNQEYGMRHAMRIRNFHDAEISIIGNVIEAAGVPIGFDCAKATDNCASGNVTISNNYISGTAVDSQGTIVTTGSGCINAHRFSDDLVQMDVTNNVFANCKVSIRLSNISTVFENNSLYESPVGYAGFTRNYGNEVCGPLPHESEMATSSSLFGLKTITPDNSPIFNATSNIPQSLEQRTNCVLNTAFEYVNTLSMQNACSNLLTDDTQSSNKVETLKTKDNSISSN